MSLGPQKGPAVIGRIRAQWRQVDTENREAVAVRQQWMRLIGCDEDEVAEHTETAHDLSLEEELEQLGAAIRLS